MDWIQHALLSPQFHWTALGAAAVLGVLLAVGSSCSLPVLAAVAGYAGGRQTGGRSGLRFAGLGFFIGTTAAMTGLGVLIGAGHRLWSANAGAWGRIGAGFAFLLFGLWILDWLPFRLPRLSVPARRPGAGIWNASVFGFAAGSASALCALTCCAPLVPILAGLAAAGGGMLWAVLVLMTVSLGYGMALTLLLLGMSLGRTAAFMKKSEKWVRSAAGLALLAAGFWLLAKG